MPFKRPLGLNGFELGLIVAIGVSSGVYIWKPILEKYKEISEQSKPEWKTAEKVLVHGKGNQQWCSWLV